MTERELKNIEASVRQRLLNKAREAGRPFGELVQYYAMERFLYRLSKSPHAKKFVLKGALMLSVWRAPMSRPTMDVDLLGRTDNDVEAITSITKEVCQQEVEADGLDFDHDSVTAERITEGAEYEGVRVRFRGHLGNVRVTMQLDIGFGDVVIPQAQTTDYPVILELPAPRLIGYSRESTIAEKLEAMVKLGILNSRMRDFFDIWLLSRYFDFDGEVLGEAVTRTFSTRGTSIPARPTALTMDFAGDETKINQWRAFVRKINIDGVPQELDDAIPAIAKFVLPVLEAGSESRRFSGTWKTPGPWRSRR
jgi:predicted nucleotidyltransferase component of viral defense system